MSSAPIGLFDSGVGGLSVLRSIRQQLPNEQVLFIADQAHVPYGPRQLTEVRAFSEAITRYLLDRGAKLVVVACNTASAAALYHLREAFPQIPFVGMEPAVKPAAEQTISGVVGVLATPSTFQGELYASVLDRFANGVTVLQDTCPGLVAQIEKGRLDSPETRSILEKALHPMLAKGVDRVVMGCTHYPFVIPMIREIVGSQVEVIDPAPAIARQTGRLLQSLALNSPKAGTGAVQVLTTADPQRLQALLPLLTGDSAQVQPLIWSQGRLTQQI